MPQNSWAARGGGRIRREGGVTPTRQSYALCRVVRLLTGLLQNAKSTPIERFAKVQL